MDDPVRDISPIVHTLCQGSPQEQEHAINTYFTPDASFTHPFCRTWSFNGSRLLIHGIFRWYKIMSPKIDLHISSIGKTSSSLISTTPHALSAGTFLPTNHTNQPTNQPS